MAGGGRQGPAGAEGRGDSGRLCCRSERNRPDASLRSSLRLRLAPGGRSGQVCRGGLLLWLQSGSQPDCAEPDRHGPQATGVGQPAAHHREVARRGHHVGHQCLRPARSARRVGDGERASADGTKWNMYEQNLLAEYHLRYGGYGGIGYYHVSDRYIALYSHFIPCGVYEVRFILDGLLRNESDLQPNTVHADTHGQSTPVFALAYLLGIELMPRIRDWKNLVFYRPCKGVRYQHIDSLFGESIDWALIEEHYDDLLRVCVSIKAGRIFPSTVLKRLGSAGRKRNKLYVAFRELGRAVRTASLLRYLANAELRATIQAPVNKSEQFNAFKDWVSFGGDVISSNDRDEQRKRVKYNQLAANCVIFHTACLLTEIVKELLAEGYEVPLEALAGVSPYLTEHINRYVDYTLNLDRVLAPDYAFRLP
nr:Tn3 family transposase [Deinococcus peraridilitoris]